MKSSINQKDLVDIIAMDQNHFSFPWNEKQWNELGEHDFLFLEKADDKNIGFILFRVETDVFHLLKVLISPEYRTSGKAKRLFKKAYSSLIEDFGDERSVFLEVQENNLSAIKFYDSLNLEKGERVKNYYSDGSSALRYFGKPKFT